MDALPGSLRRAGRSLSSTILGASSSPVLTFGTQDELDDINQPGYRSEDDPDNRDPRLMKVVVCPCAKQPADYDCTWQHESDLDAGFRLHDGCNAR